MTGGVVSRTVATSVSLADAPRPSSTVSVMVCVPAGSDTDAVAPVTVPKDPVHLQVNGSPSGSDDPVPSSATTATQAALAAPVQSGPATAAGGALKYSYAPISTRAVPSKFPSTIRAAPSRSSAGSCGAVLSPASIAGDACRTW